VLPLASPLPSKAGALSRPEDLCCNGARAGRTAPRASSPGEGIGDGGLPSQASAALTAGEQLGQKTIRPSTQRQRHVWRALSAAPVLRLRQALEGTHARRLGRRSSRRAGCRHAVIGLLHVLGVLNSIPVEQPPRRMRRACLRGLRPAHTHTQRIIGARESAGSHRTP